MYCPMKFAIIGHGDIQSGDYFSLGDCHCEKEQCAWWVTPFTTEDYRHGCCAIEMIAMKAPAQYQV